MKAGDIIRVVKAPPGLRDDDDLRTKTLFELCVGRTFAIVEIEAGLLQLDVGEVVGEPSYMQSIWIEPEFAELVESSK